MKLDLALNRNVDLFQLLLRRNTIASETCAGIAFSFCGLVDAGSQRILSTNGKYLDFEAVDLPAWSLANFNLPLRLQNDARAALLGERGRRWRLRGFDDIVIVTLGTGIGGAAMMEGRLVRGKHSQAGCPAVTSPSTIMAASGKMRQHRLCGSRSFELVFAAALCWSSQVLLQSAFRVSLKSHLLNSFTFLQAVIPAPLTSVTTASGFGAHAL